MQIFVIEIKCQKCTEVPVAGYIDLKAHLNHEKSVKQNNLIFFHSSHKFFFTQFCYLMAIEQVLVFVPRGVVIFLFLRITDNIKCYTSVGYTPCGLNMYGY